MKLRKILTLALTALMMISILAVSASAADAVTIDPAAWKCQNDGAEPQIGITADANGTINLGAAAGNWLHFAQVVTVKANTEYVLTFTTNLTEGSGVRVDLKGIVGGANETGFVEVNCRFEDKEGAAVNTDVVWEVPFTTDDVTELDIHFRNGRSISQDPWFGKAVGTISNISIVEKVATEGGDDNSNDNADTADFLPAVIIVGFAAAAVVVATKKH